ncbi:hypothetical protein TTHERM_002653383, partial (macronuclear) [Tetrahymena thermophila SB210]
DSILDLASGLSHCNKLLTLKIDLRWNFLKDQALSDLGSSLACCSNLSNLTLYL